MAIWLKSEGTVWFVYKTNDGKFHITSNPNSDRCKKTHEPHQYFQVDGVFFHPLRTGAMKQAAEKFGIPEWK